MKFEKKSAAFVALPALLCASAATFEVRPPENANEHAAYFSSDPTFCVGNYDGPEGFLLGFDVDYTFLETSSGTPTTQCLANMFTPPPEKTVNVQGSCAFWYLDGTLIEGRGTLVVTKSNKGRFICNTNRRQGEEISSIEAP